MRGGSGMLLLLPVLAVLVLAVLALLPSAAVATNYTVGDEKGWNPKVDYTAWVKKHKPFYKGDWLLFQYQNGRSDVVQVDEVGYDNCNKESAITSHNKGTSYAFQLKEAKDYFFICSYGYCYSGMKLAVTVKKGSAASSSSSSSSSDSDSDSDSSPTPASKSSSKSAAAVPLAAGRGVASFAAVVGAAAMLLRML
ncbi:mavicyanin-like [Lolium rigidum]|uniref:mavicyanin-like n=1 Tax=Lolium rigidum TaxID=89674 RepID=UPI001F5E0452|nr:mavicyanin-like [Lolium rigidum]